LQKKKKKEKKKKKKKKHGSGNGICRKTIVIPTMMCANFNEEGGFVFFFFRTAAACVVAAAMDLCGFSMPVNVLLFFCCPQIIAFDDVMMASFRWLCAGGRAKIGIEANRFGTIIPNVPPPFYATPFGREVFAMENADEDVSPEAGCRKCCRLGPAK